MKEVKLTEGPIFMKLLTFSIPMIAGNMLQQVYNIVDTLIVGRVLGADALASVGSVYTLMIFLTSVIIGLCMGSGTLFSNDFGASDEELLKKDIHHSFWFIFLTTVLISLVIYPGQGWIQRLLRTPEELKELTGTYMTVVFSGMIFVFLFNFFSYLLRALGNSMVSLVFLTISAVLNIGLDLLFVVVWHYGVGGAALATVLAQAVSAIGITIYSIHHLPLLRERKKVTWDWVRLQFIMKNDVMTGIQQSVMNFGILMIQGLVNSFGTTIMASFAAAVKIDTVAYMPAQEFGNAYSLYVSQNYGARKHERIRKGTRIAVVTSVVFCGLVSVLIFALAPELMRIFINAENTAIIAEGVRYLRIEGACYAGIGLLFLWYGYFRGMNRPQVSLLLTVISLGTRVALSYALAPHTALGVCAIWISIPVGWVLADICGYILLKTQNCK